MLSDAVTSVQSFLQSIDPQPCASTIEWRCRGCGECETSVNGFSLVVFRAEDFSGWNGAVNGRIMRGAHFRLVWMSRELAQAALINAAHRMD